MKIEHYKKSRLRKFLDRFKKAELVKAIKPRTEYQNERPNFFYSLTPEAKEKG